MAIKRNFGEVSEENLIIFDLLMFLAKTGNSEAVPTANLDRFRYGMLIYKPGAYMRNVVTP